MYDRFTVTLGRVQHNIAFLSWFISNYKLHSYVLLMALLLTQKRYSVGWGAIILYISIDLFDLWYYLFRRGNFLPEVDQKSQQTWYLIVYAVGVCIFVIKDRLHGLR